MLSKDNTGRTRVVDPPVTGSLSADANGGAVGGVDLSGISFGAHTTLAYSPSSDNTGGTLTVSDGLHAQNVALLGQYTASGLRDGERRIRRDADYRSACEPAATPEPAACILGNPIASIGQMPRPARLAKRSCDPPCRHYPSSTSMSCQ
jgi:hypothetical protein